MFAYYSMLYDTTGENTSKNNCLILKDKFVVNKTSLAFSSKCIDQAYEKHYNSKRGAVDHGLTHNVSQLTIDSQEHVPSML